MINVQIADSVCETVSNPDRLSEVIHDDIEQHIRAISDVVVSDVDLMIEVSRVSFNSTSGTVEFHLSGSLNDSPVSSSWIGSTHNESKRVGSAFRTDTGSDNAFKHVFCGLWRLIAPSRLGRAIGSRRTNGYLLKAFDDCLAEIRIRIDRAAGREPTSGFAIMQNSTRNGLLALLLSFVVGLISIALRWKSAADQFQLCIGALLISPSLLAAFYALGLLRSPRRFFESESEGRKIVKLMGTGNVTIIKMAALLMSLLAVAFFSFGIELLFRQ